MGTRGLRKLSPQGPRHRSVERQCGHDTGPDCSLGVGRRACLKGWPGSTAPSVSIGRLRACRGGQEGDGNT